MYHNADEPALGAEAHLAREWALFQSVDRGESRGFHTCWEADRPVVFVGRNSRASDQVILEACEADGVAVLRRFSGGGAVVLGPGCLNYAVALPVVASPQLADVAASFEWLLGRIVTALGIPGLSIDAHTDIALDGRKVSGNAQRRGRRALIHHGTLLYDFDSGNGHAVLEGAGPPARIPRCPPPRRVHRQHTARLPDPARQARNGLGRAHALHENSWRAVKARPAAYCKKTRRLRCAETARRSNEEVTNSQHPTSNSQAPARARWEFLGGWQLEVGS